MKITIIRLFALTIASFLFFACCSGSAAAPRPAAAEIALAASVRTDAASARETGIIPSAAEERAAAWARVRREPGPLRLGSDRLFDPEYFHLIEGRRVAIMANQTSRATVDRLISDPRVDLRAIFGPEHGFFGEVGAGLPVADADYRGVNVHARYGGGDDTRRIPTVLLADVDVLLFELQDLGTRHYTYISSMYLAMDSAADAGVRFVVLDRPVAVNGVAVEGPVLDPAFQTFIGVGGLPNRYAMTIGELALLFKSEATLMHGPRYPRAASGDEYFNVRDVDLVVVPMSGYDRTRCYDEQTGARAWIPPSPNIPSVASALCYVGSGLYDGNTIGEMVGGYEQFVYISVPFVNSGEELAAFIAAAKTHYDFPGVDLLPTVEGKTGRARLIKLEVTDRTRFNSTCTALALLYTQARQYPGKAFFSSDAGRRSFGLVHGSAWVVDLFAAGEMKVSFSDIQKRLEAEADAFRKIRAPYLLY